MGLRKGYVHIYTGEGKGKTSASLGLALRARSRGLKVCMFQFLKGGPGLSGEHRVSGRAFKIVCFREAHPMFCKGRKDKRGFDRGELKRCILEDLEVVKKAIHKKVYDIIILDEVINAVSQKFLGEEILLNLIKSKPQRVELILTGRGATKRLISCADYVTHFDKVKHPWDTGVKARRGIEY